jgi:hypothetical protein
MSYSLVYKDTKKILSRSRTISITYYTDVCYLQQSTDVLSHPLQSAQAPAHSVFSSQHPFLSAQSLVQVVQSLVQAASSAALLLLQQQDEAASIAAATARAINTFFIILYIFTLNIIVPSKNNKILPIYS